MNEGTWLAMGAVGALVLGAQLRNARRGSRRAPSSKIRKLEARVEGSLERAPPLPKLRGKGFPSARTRRTRLYQAALQGAAGRHWYDKAEREIRTAAKTWGLPPVAVAVAVAATSPATKVVGEKITYGKKRFLTKGGGRGSNIAKTRQVMKAWAAGQSAGTVITDRSPGLQTLLVFERCWWELAQRDERACLEAAFPNPETTKTHAFVRNLLGDPNAVTVDTLIANGVGVPLKSGGEPSITKARYRHIAHDMRLVARRLGWTPREAMAAAWTGWGGSGDLALATRRQRQRVSR